MCVWKIIFAISMQGANNSREHTYRDTTVSNVLNVHPLQFVALLSDCDHTYKYLLKVATISEHIQITVINSEHSERCNKVSLSHSHE